MVISFSPAGFTYPSTSMALSLTVEPKVWPPTVLAAAISLPVPASTYLTV